MPMNGCQEKEGGMEADAVTKDYCNLRHKALEAMLKSLEKQIGGMQQQLAEVHAAIRGNGGTGLVTRVSLLEESRFRVSDRRRSLLSNAMILVAVVVGVLAQRFLL